MKSTSLQVLPAVKDFLSQKQKMFIGGNWVASQSEKTFDAINPATGDVLTEVYEGDAEDVDLAVKAARHAFDHGPWKTMPASKREYLINKLANLMEGNSEVLAQLDTLDNGKPINETRTGDVPLAIDHLRYYAGWATKMVGQTIPAQHSVFTYTRHEPIGVVGQIIPWNFPLLMAAWKLGAALATGCTVVLKPAEQTPLSALYLAKLIEEAGFPEGVVNIVPGFGETAGNALVEHPHVDKVAFTGSTVVGKHILRKSADSLKKVTLELGGKSPNIILEDADLSQAIPGAMQAVMFNQGQVCAAGSRLFLDKKIYDNVVADLSSRIKDIRLGEGLDESTEMGPLISDVQKERVLNFMRKGEEEGAEIVVGGGSVDRDGYFVKPTLFADVDNSMTIAQEEIFGPVLSAIPFDGMDDLINKANDSVYGLASGVWTENIRSAHHIANELQAGTVWINSYNLYDAAVPFGGYKQSGIGREMGSYALDNYTEVKSVWVNIK